MNKVQQFAANLKARKGTAAGTARNDTPAPAPPSPRNGDPAGGSRLDRLKVELRSAIARAEKAEAELAAVERVKKVNGEIWRLNQEIARLRAAALRRQQKPRRLASTPDARPMRQLTAAWKRIEALEAENMKLRDA